VTGADKRTAVVSWFPPETSFNCIDGYEIVWSNALYPQETGSIRVAAGVYSTTISEHSKFLKV
jgi:hypothetical protein